MGIYVADADDAPGAVVIGLLLMIGAVVLGGAVATSKPTGGLNIGPASSRSRDGTGWRRTPPPPGQRPSGSCGD
jgi:hypothetical protein